MAKDSFIFYTKWSDVLSAQPPEVRLEVYEAIVGYAKNGTSQKLSPLADLAFGFIKTDLDKDFEKYKAVCERNKKNGAKGGRPKNPEKPNKTQDNPNNPLGFLETQQNPTKPKKADNEYDIDISISNNNKDISSLRSDIQKEKPKKISREDKHKAQLKYSEGVEMAPGFRSLILEWLEYKKGRNEFYGSTLSIKKLYNTLFRLGNGDPATAALITEQSMASNYAGLFELKQNNNPTNIQNNKNNADIQRGLQDRRRGFEPNVIKEESDNRPF